MTFRGLLSVTPCPRKYKLSRRDSLLLLEGILIAFLLQIGYDILVESPFYTGLISPHDMRVILVVVVGTVALYILSQFRE